MDNIFDYKQKKIHEMDQKIAEMGKEIGWDNGNGTFEILNRLADGTANELERRRADKRSMLDELTLLRMMHDRSKAIRELERMKAQKN